jgi:hypothetical protein
VCDTRNGLASSPWIVGLVRGYRGLEMAAPWVRSVRTAKQLTVFRAASASGPWAGVLTTAIARFNDLSTKLRLGVSLNAVTTPPDANGLGGANVQFATSHGAYSFQGMGAQGSGNLPANANGGITHLVSLNGECAKAFVFLPVGSGHHEFMKVCMAVHELIHATGLQNSDHSSDGDPDVFCSSLTPSGSGVQCGVFANRTMPPIWMTNRTAQKIQALWP